MIFQAKYFKYEKHYGNSLKTKTARPIFHMHLEKCFNAINFQKFYKIYSTEKFLILHARLQSTFEHYLPPSTQANRQATASKFKFT